MADLNARSTKDEVVRLLSGVNAEAQKLEQVGQNIVQAARFAKDVSGPLIELVGQVPEQQLPAETWNRLGDIWRSWHESAIYTQAVSTSAGSMGAQGFVGTTAVTSSVLPIFYGQSSPPVPVRVEEARTLLVQTVNRYDLVEQGLSEMHRLGLGSRGVGRRTSIDLLREARASLDRPMHADGGSVPILITLRECIGAVIAELVRRRPTQEPAGKWSEKVISVGRQCGHPLLPPNHFENVGVEVEKLMNELSGTKQADVPRDRLVDAFHRGILFLNGFMGSLDHSKLRPA
ncbi:hypothetical protein [Zavarzinella formosa]|uniref:hypothetical protein n=1 Tax=Zavarzinella formosa TaxID=360055 RepID=UPI0012F8CBE1|nr:hypothetical protein [Zavarzinella formosa]